MLKKISKTLILSAFVYLSLSTFVALAEDIPTPSFEERRQAREERKAQREEDRAEREAARAEEMDQRKLERCERLVDRVVARIEKMEDNREVHITNYEKIIEKLNEIIVSLTEKGLDTLALEADLATFEGMVAEYKELYSEFVSSLENYEGSVCSDMVAGGDAFVGEWKNIASQTMQEHRGLLIEKRQEIRQFFAHNIREDIKMLREQAHELFGGDESTESSEGETDE
jgi:hypothetical protein